MEAQLATQPRKITEPILRPNPNRFSLFPIRHSDLWGMYKEAESSFWQAEEVTLDKDVEDWPKLPSNVRKWLTLVLGWFQIADGIVNENLINNFSKEVQLPEARSFFGIQIAMENVHQETYAILVDTLIQEDQEKARLFDALNNFTSLRQKAEWCSRWTDDSTPFGERLVAWACCEMIMFSTSFAAIFWVKAHHHSMPGLCFSNELISRDEGLHCKFACVLFRKLRQPPSRETVHQIIRSAVLAEQTFVRDCGFDKVVEPMLRYTEYVADILSTMLGFEAIFGVTLPEELSFMQTINMIGKTNFFEKRVSAYSVRPPEKMVSFDYSDDF
tara:strand:+ start:53901 stop:54887 length:987 start_codon:yes stop_codon:yes gene_type:complete